MCEVNTKSEIANIVNLIVCVVFRLFGDAFGVFLFRSVKMYDVCDMCLRSIMVVG